MFSFGFFRFCLCSQILFTNCSKMEEGDSAVEANLKEATTNFLSKLTAENFEGVDFKETLNVTLVSTGVIIGSFDIDVKKINSDLDIDKDLNFEVTAKCSGNVDDQINCSFDAYANISFIDGYFRVNAQVHSELVKCGELKVNKVTETNSQDDGSVMIKRKINEEAENGIVISADDAKTFLSDGSSLLLMRVLGRMAWNHCDGVGLEFTTLDGDGQICRVVYYPAGSMMLASAKESVDEQQMLIKIGRELHREEKVDNWMFSLFGNGELYSWIHTNSPVYMEYRQKNSNEAEYELVVDNGEKENVDNQVVDNVENIENTEVDKADSDNEHIENVAETIPGVDQEEKPEEILHENLVGNEKENEADDNSENKEMADNLDDNDENKENIPDQPAEVKADLRNLREVKEDFYFGDKVNVDQRSTVSTGSSLHLGGLFGSLKNHQEENVDHLTTNDEEGDDKRSILSTGSSLHLGVLFGNLKHEAEENADHLTTIDEEDDEHLSVSQRMGTENKITENENSLDQKFQTWLEENQKRGEEKKEKVEEDKNENDEGIGQSGSTMNIGGLFSSIRSENVIPNKDKRVTFGEVRIAESDQMIPIENTTERTTTSSASTLHLRGLFDTYVNSTEEERRNETETEQVNGQANQEQKEEEFILGSDAKEEPYNKETPKELIELFENWQANNESMCIDDVINQSPDVIAIDETNQTEHGVTETVSPNANNEMPGDAEDMQISTDSNESLIAENRHLQLNYFFNQPTPIPEEDEEIISQANFENKPTGETDEQPPVDDEERNEEATSQNEVDNNNNDGDEKQNEWDKMLKFAAEQDNAMKLNQDNQANSSLNSARSLNQSLGFFPPINSPRDKKLTSRRLSALMNALDRSVGDVQTNNIIENDESVESKSKIVNDALEAVERSQSYLDFVPNVKTSNRFDLLRKDMNDSVSIVSSIEEGKEKDLDNEKEENATNDENDKNEIVTNEIETNDFQEKGNSRFVYPTVQSPDDGVGSSSLSDGRKTPPLANSFETFNEAHKFYKSECEGYIQNHPEIRMLLGNFVQSLLIARPEDVAQFAAAYFYYVSGIKKAK